MDPNDRVLRLTKTARDEAKRMLHWVDDKLDSEQVTLSALQFRFVGQLLSELGQVMEKIDPDSFAAAKDGVRLWVPLARLEHEIARATAVAEECRQLQAELTIAGSQFLWE